MKKLIYFFLLFLICSFSFSQNTDTLYIKYEKENKLIHIIRQKNTGLVTFKIIKDRFKTKKQQDQFYKRVTSEGIPNTSFYFTFHTVKAPAIKEKISGFTLTPIENISTWREKIGHKTKVFFIEKISCKKYLIHETRMVFEE